MTRIDQHFTVYNIDKRTISFTWEDEEGYENTYIFPAKIKVCDRCEGTGKHDHPAFSNGLTEEDFEQEGEEFRTDYLNGVYSVYCSECKGQRVTLEIDELTCDPQMLNLYREWCRDEADSRATYEAERRMGA